MSPIRTSDEVDLVAAALVEAAGKVAGVLAFDSAATIPGRDGKTGYAHRYASLPSIIAASRGPLAESGLAVQQAWSSERDAGAIGVSVTTRVWHVSGQWVESTGTMFAGLNATPQQIGQLVSYGRRYSLLGTLGIGTDEDGDAQGIAGPTREWEAFPIAEIGFEQAKAAVLTECDGDRDLARLIWRDWFGKSRGPWTAEAFGSMLDGIRLAVVELERDEATEAQLDRDEMHEAAEDAAAAAVEAGGGEPS